MAESVTNHAGVFGVQVLELYHMLGTLSIQIEGGVILGMTHAETLLIL